MGTDTITYDEALEACAEKFGSNATLVTIGASDSEKEELFSWLDSLVFLVCFYSVLNFNKR